MFNKQRISLKRIRYSIVLLVLILSTLGVIIVGSARSDLQDNQMMGVIIGLILMTFVVFVDYRFIFQFSYLYYIGAIGVLLLVKFFGSSGGGATRWLNLGFFQFQPSETVKILMILFFAVFFEMHKDDINTVKTIVISLILIAIPFYLIKSQPDLSTSILLVGIFTMMIYASGISYKLISGVAAVFIPAFIGLMILINQPNQKILVGYQLRRIMAWLNPSQYADNAAQQVNAISAIGSGQLYGKGLYNTMATSAKNANYIYESHTDFIFAVIGEELGFIGSCVIIILEFLIVLECLKIAKQTRDLSGKLICVGVASNIALQSFINISVATGLIPNTGVPLPFVTYGLSSLVSMMIGIGLVLNVSM